MKTHIFITALLTSILFSCSEGKTTSIPIENEDNYNTPTTINIEDEKEAIVQIAMPRADLNKLKISYTNPKMSEPLELDCNEDINRKELIRAISENSMRRNDNKGLDFAPSLSTSCDIPDSNKTKFKILPATDQKFSILFEGELEIEAPEYMNEIKEVVIAIGQLGSNINTVSLKRLTNLSKSGDSYKLDLSDVEITGNDLPKWFLTKKKVNVSVKDIIFQEKNSGETYSFLREYLNGNKYKKVDVIDEESRLVNTYIFNRNADPLEIGKILGFSVLTPLVQVVKTAYQEEIFPNQLWEMLSYSTATPENYYSSNKLTFIRSRLFDIVKGVNDSSDGSFGTNKEDNVKNLYMHFTDTASIQFKLQDFGYKWMNNLKHSVFTGATNDRCEFLYEGYIQTNQDVTNIEYLDNSAFEIFVNGRRLHESEYYKNVVIEKESGTVTLNLDFNIETITSTIWKKHNSVSIVLNDPVELRDRKLKVTENGCSDRVADRVIKGLEDKDVKHGVAFKSFKYETKTTREKHFNNPTLKDI